MNSDERNYKRFASMAQPHAWLLTAGNLFEQSVVLRGRRGGSHLTRQSVAGASITWDDVDRSVFLLGSFALENAIKAFLVYEHPSWISNGKLASGLRSHDLVQLRDTSTLIPYKARYGSVLATFQQGMESWARYPCALSAKTTVELPSMEDELWLRYLRLMSAYGKRLEVLLSKQWRGPHGLGGSYRFHGIGSLGSSPNRQVAQRTTGAWPAPLRLPARGS